MIPAPYTGMGARQHSLRLNPEERGLVKVVLREYDIPTQAALADVLGRTAYYSERGGPLEHSFIARVVGNARPQEGMPEAMIYGVLELTKDDSRLQFLRRGLGPITPIARDHIHALMLTYEQLARERFSVVSEQEQLEALVAYHALAESLKR